MHDGTRKKGSMLFTCYNCGSNNCSQKLIVFLYCGKKILIDNIDNRTVKQISDIDNGILK